MMYLMIQVHLGVNHSRKAVMIYQSPGDSGFLFGVRVTDRLTVNQE